jgi:hypothetical protein
MRRALRVRDKGCRWPGCDRQVSWSSPHHIIAWAKDGPSKLPNLVLLCFFHHRLVHEGGFSLESDQPLLHPAVGSEGAAFQSEVGSDRPKDLSWLAELWNGLGAPHWQ